MDTNSLGMIETKGLVSYTHLDVYKRQKSHWMNVITQGRLISGNLLPQVGL